MFYDEIAEAIRRKRLDAEAGAGGGAGGGGGAGAGAGASGGASSGGDGGSADGGGAGTSATRPSLTTVSKRRRNILQRRIFCRIWCWNIQFKS